MPLSHHHTFVDMNRNDPDYGDRWEIFVNVEINPKGDLDDETVWEDSGLAALVVPVGTPRPKVVADFLRNMADQIESGELTPEPPSDE